MHFFSLFFVLISTKLGTYHSWVKGIQFCSNDGSYPFPREDNYKIGECSDNLKICSRTTSLLYFNLESISTKLCKKQSWVKEISVCSNEGPHPFSVLWLDRTEILRIYWQMFCASLFCLYIYMQVNFPFCFCFSKCSIGEQCGPWAHGPCVTKNILAFLIFWISFLVEHSVPIGFSVKVIKPYLFS